MYILTLLIFPCLEYTQNYIFNNYNDKVRIKLMFNFISALHCIGYLFLTLGYFNTKNDSLFKLSCIYSMSYYIWDTLRIYFRKDYDNYIYIYHHLVALLILEHFLVYGLYLRISLVLYKSFILAEISNIPTFYVYYLLKKYPTYQSDVKMFYKLLFYKIIQIFLYFAIRCIGFSYILYTDSQFLNMDNFTNSIRNLGLLSIYMLGIIWSCKQGLLLKNELYKYKLLSNKIKNN